MSSDSSGGRGRGRRANAPIWAEPQPGRRRPSVTREQIAEAALALADAEGLEAVSMRRVAAALGVGTMTLYHYVRTKDDLYNLMSDTIMGELLVPDEQLDPADWRSSISAIARRSRAAFQRHPWILFAMDRSGEIGPNGMRHFEQSLAAVEGTALDGAGRLEVTALVDDLVFGNAFRALTEDAEQRDAWLASVEEYVETQLATGDYPHIARLLGDGDRRVGWERLMAQAREHDRFERGLEALLDGIARRVSGREPGD